MRGVMELSVLGNIRRAFVLWGQAFLVLCKNPIFLMWQINCYNKKRLIGCPTLKEIESMKKLINGLIVWACALSLGQKVCGRSAPVEPAVPSASQKEWEAAREDFRKKTSLEYIQEQDRKLIAKLFESRACTPSTAAASSSSRTGAESTARITRRFKKRVSWAASYEILSTA